MATTYLTRAMNKSGSTDSDKKFSYSAWIKRSSLSDAMLIEGYYSSTFYSQLYFDSNANLTLNCASGTSGAAFQIVTNRKFRDTNAWYHIFLVIDTGDSTASDRAKIYVNGVRETSFASASYPDQNTSHQFNRNGNTAYLGRRTGGGTGLYFDGLMSYIITTAGHPNPDVTAFGEYDANGVWKIKTSPSVTYGNNGFFILKDGNGITDQSGEGNDFTLGGGTLTNTEDNPSNVFTILNSITPSSNNNRAGGTRHFNNSGGYDMRHSTLAVTTGKYYAEFYLADMTGGFTIVGIQDTTQFDDYNFLTSSSRGYGYRSDGTKGNNNSSSSFGNSFTSGDYIGVAVDLDNNKIYFSKNGVWQNSGDPTSGATGTGSAFDIADGYDYCIATSSNDAGTDQITDVNFGNGYFNVTAVSSAGTNASGNGIFKYDVPTGYTALSTKGLNL